MITIKTIKEDKYGRAEMKIEKGTPYTTILLGTGMLIEVLLKENTCKNIDDLLEDLKRIYIRNNGGEK